MLCEAIFASRLDPKTTVHLPVIRFMPDYGFASVFHLANEWTDFCLLKLRIRLSGGHN